MYPHGVDPLQFTGPVLCLVFWDIWTVWTEEIDGSKVRNLNGVTRRCVEESAREGGEGEKVEEIQTHGMEGCAVGLKRG